MARNLGVIRCVRLKIDSKTALLLYDTMIAPYLTYCNLIWANCARSHLDRLRSLQKKAIRLVFMANKFTHAATLFRKLSRLTILDLYNFQLATFVYVTINEGNADIFSQYFTRNDTVHGHNTRSALNLHIRFARTSIRASSVSVNGPRYWNTLPLVIRNYASAMIFKKYLKCHLLSFYN